MEIDRRAAFWYGIMHDEAHQQAHGAPYDAVFKRVVPHSHPDLYRCYPDGYPDSEHQRSV